MGSPDFALPTLERLLAAGHELALVVTQPDRPAGRGRRLTPPPAARYARERGLPLHQTNTLKTDASRAPLLDAAPRVIVVASFGLILPSSVLDLPALGCLNLHPSLLPRHRGASPIPAALLAGDAETGVTIMLMEAGLDSGPILAQQAVAVRPEDDAISLETELAQMGASLLVDTLTDWNDGRLRARPQDDGLATYAPKIRHEDALLDWSLSADVLVRRVRAYRAWPTAYTSLRGEPLKVTRAHAVHAAKPGSPGELVLPFAAGRLRGPPAVCTAMGLLVLDAVVPAGRNEMTGEAFARGQRELEGVFLGHEADVIRHAGRVVC